jgi:hypothetical protein
MRGDDSAKGVGSAFRRLASQPIHPVTPIEEPAQKFIETSIRAHFFIHRRFDWLGELLNGTNHGGGSDTFGK